MEIFRKFKNKALSTLLIIRGMQIKTTLRYCLILVRTVILKKSTNNKCWRGCGEKGTLPHCWWECKLLQPLWKTVWKFLRKLKIEFSYDPAIPLLGHLFREKHEWIKKMYYHIYIYIYTHICYCSIIYIILHIYYSAIYIILHILLSHKKE